ncbi:KTSC domain-containing protein [Bradyrhizobium sp. RT4b]|uniref:KTSC domain-containing protein n=1 Tax=unclassified Bradyrhizobium TaxID=2631580 RepID=UPI003393AB4C
MIRLIFAFVLLLSSWAEAETVDVKYRGPVDLKPFACQDITRSSVVNRLCYDASSQYVIVQLKTTYYHYCEMPKPIVDAWLAAESMGCYYNANIKGTGKDGPYDCRTHKVPQY